MRLLSYSGFGFQKLLGIGLAGVLMSACGGDQNRDPILATEGNAVLAPIVTAVAPVNNATGVAINNTVITAQFSERMRPLTASNFTVTCEGACTDANGEVSMNAGGTIATFSVTAPTILTELTQYTATITNAASSATGVTIEAPYVWRFTTGVTNDTTRPRVTLTEPQTTDPGPTPGVPTNTAISAIFSEDINPETISDETFLLSCEFPCVAPSGAVSYAISSRTAVFVPSSEPESGTTYTATITSDVTDLAGNNLAGNQGAVAEASDYLWRFTTEPALNANNIFVQSTNPMSGGSLPVCFGSSVNATFDVPFDLRLDPTTVNNLTFLLVEHDNPLNAVAAESVIVDVDTGRIITFTAQNQLTEGVTYRATLKGGSDGIKDLAVPGNGMLEDYVWTFAAVAAIDCLEPVALNAAAPFGPFGGSAGVTNDGLLTIINGDIGTTGASTLITGFISAAGCEYTVTPLNRGQINGGIYTAPPAPTTPPTGECLGDGTAVTEQIAIQAQSDANDAFIALSPAAMPGGTVQAENLGGLTLEPGIYTAQFSSFIIEGGDLTLDAMGDQNAVWVFQMASTLSVGEAAVPRSVNLINGAQAKHVFWQVGSFATINPSGGGTMKGTIISEAGVAVSTVGNNAPELVVTIDGRALSLTASVTLVNTVINVPAP